MSFILRPEMAPNEIAEITLVAAVAVAKAIRSLTALEAVIKWPNDILIDGKKVCGILTEMKAEQDTIDFIVLGIGVNVNTSSKDLPKEATSLRSQLRLAGRSEAVSRIEIVKRILESFETYYNMLRKRGSAPVIEEWKNLSLMIGSRVKVTLPKRSFEALVHDLDRDGALIVRLDSGVLERVSSGDIGMIR